MSTKEERTQNTKNVEIRQSHYYALLSASIALLGLVIGLGWKIYENGKTGGANGQQIISLEAKQIDLSNQLTSLTDDNSREHTIILDKVEGLSASVNQLIGKLDKNLSYCAEPVCPVIKVSTVLQ